jgi:hypothetical protein
VGDKDRSEGVGGGGGTAFDLAELACPRRGATHLRAVQVPTDKVDQLVELLVEEVLHTRSVALTRTEDGSSEPAALRPYGRSRTRGSKAAAT